MRAALLVLLLAALTPLAWLQFQWIGKVNDAESDRMARNLTASLDQFGEAFDRELSFLFISFACQPAPNEDQAGAHYAQVWDAWRTEADFPELVDDLFWLQSAENLADSRLWRLQRDEQRFEPATDIRREFFSSWETDSRGARHRDFWHLRPLFPNPLALVIPMASPGSMRGRLGRGDGIQRWAQHDTLILRLDRDYVVDHVLPDLVQEHINPGNANTYHVFVRDLPLPKRSMETSETPADPPFFATDGQVLPVHVDAQTRFCSVRRFRELGPMIAGLQPSMGERGQHSNAMLWNRVSRLLDPVQDDSNALWLVSATHRDGSLESHIRGMRVRNLAVAFGVLALLGLSVALLILSAQRERHLARQQLEFVAGISHEILTPLAAIRSAAQNLKDGVVTAESRVQSYGSMIDREGGRLAEMVEHVLEFAGISSGRRISALEPVDLNEILDATVKDFEPQLQALGFQWIVDLEPQLPRLTSDRLAIRSIAHNLISNAIKYASQGRYLLLRSHFVKATSHWVVDVEDRGPGIPSFERKRIFEPFFRGHEASAGQVKGSGLGLSLVQLHVKALRGSIQVISATPTGTLFRLQFPDLRESTARTKARAADPDKNEA